MPAVIIDADACPRACLETSLRLGEMYGHEVVTVASYRHNIDSPHHIVTDGDSQAVDMVIMNRVCPGDVVVTGDWGLASVVLARGARALTPLGTIFDPDRIEFQLEERHIKAGIRRGGGRTRGPRARTSADDTRFAAALLSLLEDGALP